MANKRYVTEWPSARMPKHPYEGVESAGELCTYTHDGERCAEWTDHDIHDVRHRRPTLEFALGLNGGDENEVYLNGVPIADSLVGMSMRTNGRDEMVVTLELGASVRVSGVLHDVPDLTIQEFDGGAFRLKRPTVG